MLEEEAKDSTSSLLSSLKGNIELQLKNYETALEQISDGQLAQTFLKDRNGDITKLLNDDLKQIKEKNEFVNLVYIGTDQKEMFTFPKKTFEKTIIRLKDLGIKELNKRLTKSSGRSHTKTPFPES